MRHVLITAGSKGLGRRVTQSLLEEGYSVTIHYRSDEEAVRQLKHQWSQYKERMQFVRGDITNREDTKRIVRETYDNWGRIDILICNAGPYIFERKKLVDYSDAEWDEMIDGNLNSAFHLFKEVIPIMRNQQFGRIITYGFQGSVGTPGWIYRSAFSAAKVGLTSLTKTISIEEAENGITANMICPGKIVGDMKEAEISEAKGLEDEETPIGRPGSGEDIARSVLFLVGDEADMVTGAVLDVTGGMDVVHRYRSISNE
ncbi:SDR family oxidoreductase [Texcoconibacillus texcoconensis]|uniref:3-oxoacyl-[acyl-carrier protein] reductase n=1 Tax=Texcoconibacillus texcoconensis TaxID=1095777 RepID=A0A840QMX6_9BACI|nr:SDR family oxidoreductase [Texcoconibacillus texcoconensis]MBB5172742.1 3-oxoacyl-[acyl-carrier protein] reductase [Texcoconibacillus texcoconensis]